MVLVPYPVAEPAPTEPQSVKTVSKFQIWVWSVCFFFFLLFCFQQGTTRWISAAMGGIAFAVWLKNLKAKYQAGQQRLGQASNSPSTAHAAATAHVLPMSSARRVRRAV
jgi:hypothetical protein